MRRSLFRPEFLIERLGLAKLLRKGSVARSLIKLMAHLILICAENNTDVWILGKSLNHSFTSSLLVSSWAPDDVHYIKVEKKKGKISYREPSTSKGPNFNHKLKAIPPSDDSLTWRAIDKFFLTFSLNVKLTSCLQYLQWYSYNTILFKQRQCLGLQRVIKQYINETDKPKTQRSIFSADLPTQSWHCSRDVGQCNEDHRKTSQPFIFLQKCVVGNPSQRQVTVISWSSYYMDC